MNPFTPGIALLALSLAAHPAIASEARNSLETQVTMLVGFPETAEDGATVLIVPGTVIPVSKMTPTLAERLHRESSDIGEALAYMTAGLERALGLVDVDIAYREMHTLGLDERAPMRGPSPESSVSGNVTLLGFNDELATYRVELFEGSTPLADSKVAVERGQRAVVGGLDGESAPFFFVVLEPAPAAPRAIPFDAHVGATPPRAIQKLPPEYTETARENRVQGVVIVQTLIDRSGRVAEVNVLKGLPMGLSEAAVEAIRQWTFEPARDAEGNPVEVYYNLTVNFRLTESGED